MTSPTGLPSPLAKLTSPDGSLSTSSTLLLLPCSNSDCAQQLSEWMRLFSTERAASNRVAGGACRIAKTIEPSHNSPTVVTPDSYSCDQNPDGRLRLRVSPVGRRLYPGTNNG